MTNNIPTGSKLDEAVKNTLSHYEAPDAQPDWGRMESMLDAAPAAGKFKWSYAIGAVIGLAAIGGGWLIYSSSTAPTHETPAPVPAVVKTAPVTTTPSPAAQPLPAATETATPPVTPAETATEPAVTTTQPAATANNTESSKLKTVVLKDKSAKKEKTAAPSTNPADDVIIHQKVMGMGEDPVFGDMIDPSKGIVGETQEKDETKKAAVSKKGPVAWDAIMLPNVNVDSLRKSREKRDSLHR